MKLGSLNFAIFRICSDWPDVQELTLPQSRCFQAARVELCF